MKTSLKILAALVSVVVVVLSWSYVRYRQNEHRYCDTVTLTGEITPETFVKVRDCLARSEASNKTFVVEASEGGDNASAMALGMLIHRHHWNVEIVDHCASACATFIFAAGKKKYLHRHTLLLFHGGLHQENLLEFAEKFVLVPETDGVATESVTLGQPNKENTFSLSPKTDAYREVHKFLSVPDLATPVEIIRTLRDASDQLYQELGINPLLPTYGQIGAYEPTYKSYEFVGFIYRLDSLRRFGVTGIELKDGEWQPEHHAAYAKVYEVTYP